VGVAGFLHDVWQDCRAGERDELLASFAPELRGTVSIRIILSKKIFEAHEGTFAVESANGGVRFITRIPLKTNGKNLGR
jgi:hypothetical protein